MRLAIYSPNRKAGTTSISILLSAMLAEKTTAKVCLSYTGKEAESFNRYLGRSNEVDMTKTLSQLIRLLEAGTISREDVLDYVVKLSPGLDFIHTDSKLSGELDADRLVSEVLDYLPHDIIVTDINTEVYKDVTIQAFDKADIILVLLTQDEESIQNYLKWKEGNYFPDESKFIYAINKFDPVISAARSVCTKAGVKYRRACKVSYNPWITKLCNSGKLLEIIPNVLKKDIRLVELFPDLKDLSILTANNIGIPIDWKDE